MGTEQVYASSSFTYSTVIHLRPTKWSSGDGMHKHNIISVNRKRIWTKNRTSLLYCVSALVQHVSFLHSWLVCLLFQGTAIICKPSFSQSNLSTSCVCIFYYNFIACFGIMQQNGLHYKKMQKVAIYATGLKRRAKSNGSISVIKWPKPN